ncbi:MAG: ATP-binding protein [Halioglobus sp.]
MSFWQPRSLSQLVLVSFFAAIAPLSVTIVFTLQTLGEMADKNREITRTVVEVTRLGQDIQHNVLELERRTRQYLALNDTELADLFELERTRLANQLELLQDRMPSESPDIKGLLGSLARLDLAPVDEFDGAEESVTEALRERGFEYEFSVISEQNKAVAKWLQSSVDQLLKRNTEEADSHIRTLQLQLTLMAAATLALLSLITYWINKPVKDLTQEIHNLGTAGLSHPIEISGPLELQALGSELEWLRKGLHESEQQKELFLRHISHELKTPLSSLREGAELLAEQVTGHLSQQQLEIVEIVRLNGIELQRLIENLLDFNRLRQQVLNLEKIELQSLWQELLGNYSLSLSRKALRLQQRGDEATWVADRYKLKTSLDNLLSNAVNYTPEGGCIDITWHKKDSNLVIDVANSGAPIPYEDADRVFEPFFQSVAQRTGPIKGSGIGLSVARECIEAQGGSLTLAPHDKLSVCFRLICPAH